MIGALDPLFCLFPNLNEIMIAVVRVNSGSGTQMPRGGSEPRGRSRTARTGSSRVVARVAEVVARVACQPECGLERPGDATFGPLRLST